MRNYKIAVTWKETSTLTQKEQTLERAIKKTKMKFIEEGEPPSPGDFVEGSLEVDEEATVLLNKMSSKKKPVEEIQAEEEPVEKKEDE